MVIDGACPIYFSFKGIMRFPSLIRLPRNRRFNIEPRYYDPVKEEIKERTRRIKLELEGKSKGGQTPGKITFQRKTESIPNASFLQMLIAAVLGVSVIGWLYYGNDVFYALWLIVPVYLYFRLRRPKAKRN